MLPVQRHNLLSDRERHSSRTDLVGVRSQLSAARERMERTMIEHYYPNSKRGCASTSSTFDQLHEFKASRSLPSWNHAIEALLASAASTAIEE